jgi:hypothetical protein
MAFQFADHTNTQLLVLVFPDRFMVNPGRLDK